MPDTPARLNVRELKGLESSPGKPFSAVLIIKRITTKTASNGNPFLSVELGDRGGTFSCTVFSDNPAFEAFKAAGEGSAIRIEGKSDSYQGRFSPRLTAGKVLGDDELAADGSLMESLVEVAPEDAGELWADLQKHVEMIAHDELRMTARAVFDEIGETFRTGAAAISMHHAYRHGLLEHTVHMARVCKALLPLYPEVDASLAMAGVLLHDTGKVIEYEGSLSTRRSRKGILQGHVVLGYQLVRKAGLRSKLDADRLERLEHIILSHQGEPEWGAAAWAATPEAVFVSMIDNLDAKMGMVQRALRQAAEGEEFSERLPGLNTSLLTRPVGQ
ncbi:3'-5' exoribonuclease YhaM [mine drainage metagenome]|uniref:3'-5' exoribonuclease YhaM n=1 Tax=mine drainage metagenome TaxID=410659 RepID=A0A1J5SUA5_9ZZZZ